MNSFVLRCGTSLLLFFLFVPMALFASGNPVSPIPLSLEAYNDEHLNDIMAILSHRIAVEPLNLVAAIIFLCAIIHAFLAGYLNKYAHKLEVSHNKILEKEEKDGIHSNKNRVSFKATLFHFLGEVEAVFGIWVIGLAGAIMYYKGWDAFKFYVAYKVNFTEPVFVVVIMAIASTRPIMYQAERILQFFAGFFQGSPGAYWMSILTITPILGSFITEPAAMTIAALLLGKQFYEKKPSKTLAYATIGLLFVNISIGGSLTNFAAPPVLMVAGVWDWSTSHMVFNFGWKAIISIILSSIFYFSIFKKEFSRLKAESSNHAIQASEEHIPFWVAAVHILFMVWTVFTAHYVPLFLGGFLFFLAFIAATHHHQYSLRLRSPLLVGFFLAGLVIHGGLQGWWIAPILGNLTEIPLFVGAVILTAFNDNAAITYLTTLVPNFGNELRYAVVAGALTGGGLTVIANAPNPAGQSILQKYFAGGLNPLLLFVGAIIPTVIAALCFMFL